ncbi:MAG: SDR family NAD(P)-dependent oxidoreductase [Burkholderiales bacterium]|nr:SDR family NAD(P)-dependent oxidoreductase [Burkholderiales bacterium]
MSSARTASFRARYGDWAVVTGASDGIGRAFAESVAARGLNLLLVARRGDVMDTLAGELSAKHAIQCDVVATDLATDSGLACVQAAGADRDIGLLVSSAGFGTSGEFVQSSLDVELDMLAVNCRATTTLAHHFGRRFAAQRRGGMVLMSSLLAFQGVPRAAHYAATKAYVQVLAEGLRHELRNCGVDVIAAAPGPVATGFAERANMQMGLAARPREVAEITLHALGRRTTVRPGWLAKLLEASLAPLPRWGRTRMLKRVMGGMTAHQRSDPTRSSERAAG